MMDMQDLHRLLRHSLVPRGVPACPRIALSQPRRAGLVRGIPMLIAGIVAGYCGAHFVKGLSEKTVRQSILIFAWGLTAYFFVKPFIGR
jgi:hypothetical protein